MRAVVLPAGSSAGDLVFDEVAVPSLEPGEALVRVRAAAITKDELEWPADRLPAIPSYEVSGVVAAVAPDVGSVTIGDAVFGLTPFDRDGVAAEFAAIPADVLAPKPRRLGHVEAAATPLAGLSAWQGLFDHGELERGQRVLITGATGGVGHLAVQLATDRGAFVIAVASPANADLVTALGARHVLDARDPSLGDRTGNVDLVFDTAGGEVLTAAIPAARTGGRVVSVAEEPQDVPVHVAAVYFVVEANRAQLVEIAGLVDEGKLKPRIDSVFPLSRAVDAFERSMSRGKRGKVVLRVIDG